MRGQPYSDAVLLWATVAREVHSVGVDNLSGVSVLRYPNPSVEGDVERILDEVHKAEQLNETFCSCIGPGRNGMGTHACK